jgi:ribonuclease VapC
MIVDSSVLIALLLPESDAPRFADVMATAPILRLSAAAYLETAIVVDGNRNPILSRRLDELLRTSRIVIEPVTAEQARIARAAYRDFGKGSGHPAQLNFGDCFAYALATTTAEPLLFKGNDFSQTDLASALPRS